MPAHNRLLSTGCVAVVLLVGLAVGCTKSAPTAAPVPNADAPAVPLTDEEYQEFGRKLEAAVAAGDQTATDRLFRIREIMERVDRDLDIDWTPEDREKLRRTHDQSSGRTGQDVITAVRNGGSYTFLRVHAMDGKKRVLMRLLTPEGPGVSTYYEMLLTRYPDGQVGASDIYSFTLGAFISDHFQRATLTTAGEMKPEVFARLSAEDQRYIKYNRAWLAMTRDVLDGRHREALAAFRALPAEVQREKEFQLWAIRAAKELGDDEYLAELERFRRNHPNDGALELFMIDYFIIRSSVTRRWPQSIGWTGGLGATRTCR